MICRSAADGIAFKSRRRKSPAILLERPQYRALPPRLEGGQVGRRMSGVGRHVIDDHQVPARRQHAGKAGHASSRVRTVRERLYGHDQIERTFGTRVVALHDRSYLTVEAEPRCRRIGLRPLA